MANLEQDWKPLVLKKSQPKTQVQHCAGNKEFHKLDSEEAEAPKILGLDAAKLIQTSRCALNLTQVQLAQKINEKANLVKDYETGKVVPNRAVLNKINRVLGIKIV